MSVDNFDTLSNKELYTKCTEYGLSNIPVTNSSRGIILKRLRAAFSETSKNVSKVQETTARDHDRLRTSIPTKTNHTKISNTTDLVSDISNNSVVTATKSTENNGFTFNTLQDEHINADLKRKEKDKKGSHEQIITTIGSKGFYGTSKDESKLPYVSTATKTNQIKITNTTKQESDLSSNCMPTEKNNNTKDHVFLASKIYGTSKNKSIVQQRTADRDILHESTPIKLNQSKISNTTVQASDLGSKPVSTAKNNTDDYVFNFFNFQHSQANTGVTTNVHKDDKAFNQHIKTTTTNTKSKDFYRTSENKSKIQDTTTDRDNIHESTLTKTKISNNEKQVPDLSNNKFPVSTSNNNTEDNVFTFNTLQHNHTGTALSVINQKVNQGSYEHIMTTIPTAGSKLHTINTSNVNEKLHGLIHSGSKFKTFNNIYVKPIINEDAKSHDHLGSRSKLNTFYKAHPDIGEDVKSQGFKILKGSVSLTKSAVLTTSYHQEASLRGKLIESYDIRNNKDAQARRVERIESLKSKYNSGTITQNFSNDPLEEKPKIELKVQKSIQTYLHDFDAQKYINSSSKNISHSNSTPLKYLSDLKFGSVSSSKIQFDYTTPAKKPQILKLNILRPNITEATTTNPEYITKGHHPYVTTRRRESTTFNAQQKYPTDCEYVESQSNENYLTRTFSSFLPRIVRSTLRHLETECTNNTFDDDEARHRFIQTLQQNIFKQSLAFIMGFVLAAFIYVYIM
ncbi:uncharacterized protein LOC119670437 isoform X2 [Teleopsis dalmanni]|uniref:uncharacterized protein LOC119670437 isoform X2 n=1 Tax=Teleopsis dalmanni TaxID=139649 RepID=UPI0018CE3EAE|nr:uncharacterized protein LOC119670437 isoform X2 [Teleopsis dalmanni]